MKQRISSHLLNINALLAVTVTLIMFFASLWLVTTNSGIQSFMLIALMCLMGLFILHLARVKTIAIEEQQLVISRWGKKAVVPLSSVADIKRRYLFKRGLRLVEIDFAEKTSFGYKVPFALPTPTYSAGNEARLDILRNAIDKAKRA